MRRPVAVQRHREVEIPAIQRLVVNRIPAKDQVVDRQDGRCASQVHQQVFGCVIQLDAGQQAIERRPSQLSKPDGHTPRLVAERNSTSPKSFQSGDGLNAFFRVVEEAQAIAEKRHEGARQAFRVATQARAAMDGGGEIEVDGHGWKQC